jgi:hypothetical protein
MLEESDPPSPQTVVRGPRSPRRRFFGATASSLLGLLAACGPGTGRTEVVKTAEGKVLQWERDELLVLVSGLQDSYRRGEEIRLKVILNNQTATFGLYRLRTKLAGRGQQVVVEAPLANLQVKPFDAGEIERVLSLTPSLEPGDYTIIVELPPWSLEGRTIGGGALSAPVRLER